MLRKKTEMQLDKMYRLLLRASIASSTIQQFENDIAVSARCGLGQWYHVAYLNMSDPTQQCPPWPSLRLYSANGVRACGRLSTIGAFGCSSLIFASGDSRQYSKVCGQVIGYQIQFGGSYWRRRISKSATINKYWICWWGECYLWIFTMHAYLDLCCWYVRATPCN